MQISKKSIPKVNLSFFVKQISKTKTVWICLFYTFGITWSCLLIIIIANQYFNTLLIGSFFYWILIIIGSLGPAIGSYVIYKKENYKTFGKSFFNHIFFGNFSRNSIIIFWLFSIWRVFMIWLAFGIDRPISIIGIILNLPFLIVLGGLEELGWRGFLQPKLEKVTNYFSSILITGTIWSLWHIPLWFIRGSVQSSLPFLFYLISGLILTSSFTTLYKLTGNIFLTILSHAWFNGFINLALYTASDGTQKIDIGYKIIILFGIEFILSTILSIYFNFKNKENLN